ncbi:MAG: phosphoribosylamine--glycine ligase [Armatimonadetes bacterium]|nr:phosphoribosylamine--glycine ligase [Armatimonadota bacterium]
MRVLLIGSGGREHALAWKLASSPALKELWCAPGNAGIARHARLLDIAAEDLDGLVAWATAHRPDLVIVGPERPLIRGLADRLTAAGVAVYGPQAAAARLEGSKAFTNELLARHGLGQKEFAVFTDPVSAKAYIRRKGAPIVVKADGDAFGKGVKVASTVAEAEEFVDRCMVDKIFGPAGETVVIEECLFGQECTIKVFTDGETVLPMVPSQDYKRVGDGDTGPNTGGMGCYSPVPVLDEQTFAYVVTRIIQPTVRALADEGIRYVGTLYAGVILTPKGPRVLEYNCRFGDPETQVVLPRLESDLLEILQAAVGGRLQEVRPQWSDRRCVCVVMASGGYPEEYEKGKIITGIGDAEELEDVVVFHAGTAQRDGQLVTSGGRVLGVTALGNSFATARSRAYEAVSRISFEKCYYRRDIALRAVEAESNDERVT